MFHNYLRYTISIPISELNKKHSIENPNVDKGLPIIYAINSSGVGKSNYITNTIDIS